MITNHPQFIEAISETKMVKVRYYSMADSGVIERLCAPMDYGPAGEPEDGLNRYWLWDYGNHSGSQTLGLRPQQIVDLQVLGEEFQPGDFGAERWPWRVPRAWGRQHETTANR